MKYRCLIVDDEPLGRKVIEDYIARLPSLELVGLCSDACEAAARLHEVGVDLMFLDIRMPGMSGVDLLATLDEAPLVILTTAHAEYAVEGFEHEVTDYLLKPIRFERFLKAVNKATRELVLRREGTGDETSKASELLFIRADKVEHAVRVAEIICVEGARNSIKIHTTRGTITAPKSLSAIARELPGDTFLRVHKSFLVAVDRIRKIEGPSIQLDELEIPIGKTYRADLERLITSRRFPE